MNQPFTESDIRPPAFDEDKERALQEDLQWLETRKSQFVEVACPACASCESEMVFSKYTFQFVRCLVCDTVYMSPRATPEILKEFYSSSQLYDYWNKYIFPASDKARRENLALPRLRRILRSCEEYHIPLTCLLEAGAACGMFCDETKKTGKFDRVIAVEPNVELAEKCRTLGLDVIEDTIEKIQSLEVPPNVVVAFEVIEHLFSPRQVVTASLVSSLGGFTVFTGSSVICRTITPRRLS